MALSKPIRTDIENMLSSAAGSLLVAANQAKNALENVIENIETYGFAVTAAGAKDFAEQILGVPFEDEEGNPITDSQEWADSLVAFKIAVDSVYTDIFVTGSGANVKNLRRNTKDR